MHRVVLVSRSAILWTAIASGVFAAAPLAANLAASEPQRIRNATYVRRGDVELKADVYIPAAKGSHPAVLVVHGGAWRSGNRFQMTRICRSLVESGYVAATIDYRLAPKERFPAQIEDCKAAVRWMRTNAGKFQIDEKRIGGYGYSAGGHLVSLLGVTDSGDGLEGTGADGNGDLPSTRLQAVVAGGAPCDFELMPIDNRYLAYWLGGTRREKPDVYRLASPARFVSHDDPPMFFYHGQRDALVPTLSPENMVAKLKAADVPARLVVIPDAGHVRTFLNTDATKQAVAFLDSVLKPKPTPKK